MSWAHPRWLIDLYLVGFLTRPRGEKLRAHLRECEACRGYYDKGVLVLRATRGNAEGLGLGELARLEERTVEVTGAGPSVSPGKWPMRKRQLVVGMGLLLLLVLGLSWWPHTVGVVFAAGQQLEIDGRLGATGSDVASGALVTASKGDSAVLLEGNRGVLLREGASARFNAKGAEALLEKGRARFSIKPKQGGFTVLAGGVTVRVRGTIFVVDRRTEEETLIAVHRGEVQVTSGGTEVILRDGQESTVTRGVPSPARRASNESLEEDRGDFLVWLKRAWRRLLGNLDQEVGR